MRIFNPHVVRQVVWIGRLAESQSSAGNGTPQRIAVELRRSQTGLDIVHVPYEGAGPATIAVSGGEVTSALVGVLPLFRHLASGKPAEVARQLERAPRTALQRPEIRARLAGSAVARRMRAESQQSDGIIRKFAIRAT